MYEGGQSFGLNLDFVASPHAAISDRGQVLLSEHYKLQLREDI